MKKLLIIAYAFPPVGGAGCQRPVKFVKYLHQFGWIPLVLTVEKPSVPLIDESLLSDIPFGTKIFRAPSLEPSYSAKKALAGEQPGAWNFKAFLKKIASSVMLPDIHILWWPGLICELWRVLRTEKPACLFVTAPPFSSFIPVVIVGKLFRLPVIIDFRDEWSFSRQQWENARKSSLAFRIDRLLERFVLTLCTDFTTVSASYVTTLHELYPTACKGKGKVITNGYDEEDFLDVAHVASSGDLITIVYAGTVWNGNSLENFALALKRLTTEQPELAGKLRVKIFGRVVDQHRQYLDDPGLAGIITLYGYVDHSCVIHEMCSADLLLLAVSDLPGAEKIIVGKVFEYMASGKHIFAVVPQGETRNILQENYNKLTIVNSDALEDIHSGLLWILSNREAVLNVIHSDISQFSRRELTEKLANVLEKTPQRFISEKAESRI